MTATEPTESERKDPHKLAKQILSVAKDSSQVTMHSDPEVFGSGRHEFLTGLITQMVNIGSQGQEMDEEGTAFVASVVGGLNPRDELESMLAVQMAAVHKATVTAARRLAHVENIPQQDSAERMLNKLARTFTMQMQALQKYRTGGKQRVVVKHVHVNEGGQAVIGNVSARGSKN